MAAPSTTQTTIYPLFMAAPAQPTAILRGHRTQVHAAAFVRVEASSREQPPPPPGDRRLATGDADGFVVLWDLAIVRPRAVWRAHTNSILGLAGWGADQVVTHGRDHKLIVWQAGAADEARLSTALPLAAGEEAQDSRPQPWVVHVLDVNSMNFCAFAWCPRGDASSSSERLVAVPNALSLEAVDIFHLPSQQRRASVMVGVKGKDGMLMALALFYRGPTLVVIAAFENGAAVVAALDESFADAPTICYRAQPHTQPILSLDVVLDRSYFLTSGADAVLAKHPIPLPGEAEDKPRDEPIHEPANDASLDTEEPPAGAPVSLLSAALAREKESPTPASRPRMRPPPPPVQTQPLQVVNTKHAGQQGLCIRSDGRLVATAGWDGRVRVYAARTLKPLAVLKWHQTGCFAVAFVPVAVGEPDADITPAGSADSADTQLARPETSVKARRLHRAATAHWLAAGSKDGKVSLWDIF